MFHVKRWASDIWSRSRVAREGSKSGAGLDTAALPRYSTAGAIFSAHLGGDFTDHPPSTLAVAAYSVDCSFRYHLAGVVATGSSGRVSIRRLRPLLDRRGRLAAVLDRRGRLAAHRNRRGRLAALLDRRGGVPTRPDVGPRSASGDASGRVGEGCGVGAG